MQAHKKVPENGCTGEEHLKVMLDDDRDKLDILINLVDTNVYAYISKCTTYADAVDKLNRAYVKPINEVFARHRLNTSRQDLTESLGDFLQRLKILSDDCN